MGWTWEGRTAGLALLWPGAREEITRKSRVSYRANTFKLAPSATGSRGDCGQGHDAIRLVFSLIMWPAAWNGFDGR